MGVLDGAADLRAGEMGHHQLARVAMQLDSLPTDLQPEVVHGPGRRVTPGPILAPTSTAARSASLARCTTPFARCTTPFATRTSTTLATRASTTLATGPTSASTTLTTRAALASWASTLPRATAVLASPLPST